MEIVPGTTSPHTKTRIFHKRLGITPCSGSDRILRRVVALAVVAVVRAAAAVVAVVRAVVNASEVRAFSAHLNNNITTTGDG
jgi:hypothetical protein